MAWVAGADVTTGDLITAAQWNTYLGATGSLEFLKGAQHIFIPPCWGVSGGVEELNKVNDRVIVRLQDANDEGYVAFRVPDSFTTITKAVLILRPRVTQGAANLDIYSDYAAIGELSQAHTESDVGSTYNIVNDTLFELNVSGILSNLVAGDYVGIRLLLADAAHDVDLLGFYMTFT